MTLTADQVASLAPDDASLRAGRGLASAAKWHGVGQSERALWGLCQGSGSKPYETQVDLAGPACRCSCPSRKFPCKHAIGLLLLNAAQPAPIAEPPDWVAAWLASREQREERVTERAERPAAPPDPAAQAKREARREERVADGIAQLHQWLDDLGRQGLAAARQRGYGFFDEAAARLVDAQAAGLASRVRTLGGLAVSGDPRWADRMLEEAGMLHLLATAYGRSDQLPDGLRADVRSLVGWNVPRDAVLARPRVRDTWAVVAQQVEDDDRLRTQRVWLHGAATDADALILTFAPPTQPLDLSFVPGTAVDASLCFYDAAVPLRALLAEQHGPPQPLTELAGVSIGGALERRAHVLAAQPWLWRLPVTLAGVVPVAGADGPVAAERDGEAVPLAADDAAAWRLVAFAGGQPVTLFGEWRGDRIRPLSAVHERRWIAL